MQAEIETIKKLKKSKTCLYPNCPNKSLKKVMLPVGELINEQIEFPQDGKNNSCNLCFYHSNLAKEGILILINQDGIIRLVGPFDVIKTCEAIFKVMNK